MTTQTARGLTPISTEEAAIADYLERHADFFERHQDMLAGLSIPHLRSGSTISLVERQVEVLRERQSSSDTRLTEFIEVARANDQLAQKMHLFTRRLMRARDLAETLTQIEASLREDFDASLSRLVLVGIDVPKGSFSERFLRSVAADDAILRSFENLFATGKPRCGQVRDSHREFLFSEEANDIGSVALVPLGDKGSLGLLAVGSSDRNRFHPGMSTDFLAHMGELVADAIKRS
jgi:hypothetical protein